MSQPCFETVNLFLYRLILWLAFPVIFLRLLWRSRRNPAYRWRWQERLGQSPFEFQQPPIWIHAVSVGETQASLPLVQGLRQQYPGIQILISNTTPTGADQVARLFGEDQPQCYLPLDYPFAIRRFLDRVKPRVLLLMETEVWPNLLLECQTRGIPVVLANARMSAKSASRYLKLGDFARQLFAAFSSIAAQSQADAERFIRLGARPQCVQVTGSLKFDLTLAASLFEQAEVLRRELGQERPIWVAASTREGEEPLILAAHQQLLETMPNALLVLVPRHPERFTSVAALCQNQGFVFQQRSQGGPCQPQTQVYLADSMGELPLLLAAADAAFVGGSLKPLGGHNVLEAAVLGKPVAFGPWMFNFTAISELLLQEGAAAQVRNPEELARQMQDWLGDAALRLEVGEKGRQTVEKNRGAGERLLALVNQVLAADNHE